MAEFDDLSDRLRRARGQLDAAAVEVRVAEDQLTRVQTEEAGLARVFQPAVPEHAAKRKRLEAQRRTAETQRKEARERQAAAARAEAAARVQFAPFSDPRSELPRLKDATPILMLPVRVEARFKDVVRGGIVGIAHELWVRIYPDDCWIDSFDPRLAESEAASARAYWIAIWAAGGIEPQERAAWRALVRAHGPGRAAWIVETFKPGKLAARPSKARPEDVILTMVADAPLPEREQTAAGAFWREAWLAEGDASKLAAARSALANAVGADRAAEIIERLKPDNFDAPLGEGVRRDRVGVSSALLVLGSPDAREQAWSRAPSATLLPDRFVCICYHQGEAPIVAIGRPVAPTVIVGPDPSAGPDEQLRLDRSGNMVFPDELAWIADFGKAVEIGMGLQIEIPRPMREFGFERIIVLGVRMSADERTAQTELETLLRHHAFGRSGLSIVPQGTPTNNTDAVSSAAGRGDIADESFDDRKAPAFIPTSKWFDKKDGQWLAEALGVNSELFAHVHHAGGTDQSCERAMNMALWPATLGYWMESLMAPVFPAGAVDLTRRFFTRYVVGSGSIPAIRIGSQPYGILPATALSRMRWFNQAPADGSTEDALVPFVKRLHPILQTLGAEWQRQVRDISFTGKPGGDPHQILLDILGLHSGSVEWSSRDAESRMSLYNRLNLQGLGNTIDQIVVAVQWINARELLTRLGYQGVNPPVVMDYVFAGAPNALKGGVVDDRPLSEVEGVRAYTTGGKNYLQWLIDAATTSLERLYAQGDFVDDKPPTALLYLLLRHALQLGYHDTSLRLHEQARVLTAAQVAAARIDQPILHVSPATRISESRYQTLFAVQPAIVGAGSTSTVAQFISSRMPELPAASRLLEQIAALGRLEAQPTARLERAFADHMDCCSYRLDAWTLGLVSYQLATMRRTREGEAGAARQGIYLGAYGWLERVHPREQPFTSRPPVVIPDPTVAAEFAGPNEAPLLGDATNQGFIHAPSLNQAVAAAVLRNGYISTATPEMHDTLAVNLTSERMRTATWLLDGVRAGQGLGDLLGYQFERGLHDLHEMAEVDKFIYPLRKAFPLRADRMQSTATPEGVSIESIEARNVIDGLALANQIRVSGSRDYPFGKSGLPPATPAEAAALTFEADRLLSSLDAVADLALAEGVYQAVLGNYDRAAANYDAYARGGLPPQPDIIRTPTSGFGLTHRVALHLAAGSDHAVSPDRAVAMTPRAQAEPALNAWLAALLPPLSTVGCIVAYHDASAGRAATREITLDLIGIQPADLVALAGSTHEAMSEFDDRLADFATAKFGVRPDAPVTIRYREKKDAALSLFEILPLVRTLKTLTSGARPLRPSDLSLPSEARTSQDAVPIVNRTRISVTESAMRALAGDFSAFVARVDGLLSERPARSADLLDSADALALDVAALLARAALFGVPQAGRQFARDFRRRVFAGVLAQAADLVTRWTARLAEFDARIAEHDALPGTAGEADRFRVLDAAEITIATRPVVPRPATSAALRAQLVETRRKAFVERLDRFKGLQRTTRTRVADLMADLRGLLPVVEFDPAPFSIDAYDQAVIQFAKEARTVAASVGAALNRRMADTTAHLAAHDASGVAVDRARALGDAARALFGDDFLIVPEFSLTPAQRDELANALGASRSGAPFDHLVHPASQSRTPVDFPVDTWLHGAARVRERLRAWEQMTIIAGAFGRSEPALDALQLPHVPGDRWLGLELPKDYAMDADRLLYTAHFAAPLDASDRLCGLLVDEWTETIPTPELDTGVAFHYDRPNAESPQAMLLVTPSEFRGGWQWDDVVDAVNDTLDLAKRRAVEPSHIDRLPIASFLPATTVASQVHELTIAANLSLNNNDLRSGE